MYRQIATDDLVGKSVTITRTSPMTGKSITRTFVIQGAWSSYNGTEVGMPVILDRAGDRYEVLSPAEQATAR